MGGIGKEPSRSTPRPLLLGAGGRGTKAPLQSRSCILLDTCQAFLNNAGQFCHQIVHIGLSKQTRMQDLGAMQFRQLWVMHREYSRRNLAQWESASSWLNFWSGLHCVGPINVQGLEWIDTNTHFSISLATQHPWAGSAKGNDCICVAQHSICYHPAAAVPTFQAHQAQQQVGGPFLNLTAG